MEKKYKDMTCREIYNSIIDTTEKKSNIIFSIMNSSGFRFIINERLRFYIIQLADFSDSYILEMVSNSVSFVYDKSETFNKYSKKSERKAKFLRLFEALDIMEYYINEYR